MTRPVAVLLLVICTMLWGLAFVAQKTAMDGMGPLTYAGIRYLMASVAVAPFALREWRRERPRIGRVTQNQWQRIAILTLIFFIGVWLQQAALITATATNGGFLTALYVIFVPILLFVVRRVRPHPIVIVAAPAALVGIYLLTGARFDNFTIGDGMLVACAVFWAGQVTMLSPLVRETRMPVFVSLLNFLGTGLLAIIGALMTEHPTLAGISSGWVEIVYGGIFSSAIAFSFQAIGQQYVPPANAAIILSAESLFAALGGALILGDRLPPLGYLGAALIFIAIVVVETVPILADRRKAFTSS